MKLQLGVTLEEFLNFVVAGTDTLRRPAGCRKA